MRQIIIVGSPGSGKTTLARALGHWLGISVISLDSLFWKSGWRRVPCEKRQSLLAGCLRDKSGWIVEGDDSPTQDYCFSLADTIIFLDLPLAICLWRVFKRNQHYFGKSCPGMAAGCPAHLPRHFLKQIIQYPYAKRPKILASIQQQMPTRQVRYCEAGPRWQP